MLLTGPDWPVVAARELERGVPADRIIVMPTVHTAYWDYWSLPLDLIETPADGRLSLGRHRFERHLAGMGDFFGRLEDGVYKNATERYRPGLSLGKHDAAGAIGRVIGALGDDDSRRDYVTVLFGEPHVVWRSWARNLFNHLEYTDYVSIAPGDVVLNCGVHGGGEIPYFLAAMQGQGKLVNLDPLGCQYVSPYTTTCLSTHASAGIELAVALHDQDGELELPVDAGGMAAGGRAGERIPGLVHRTFPCRRIDAIVQELRLDRVDYIKMDIEGAEPQAIRGAAATISRFRPQLAISIYHEHRHFWEIPLQLFELCPGYRFFLKHYHFIANETVLYAVPSERPIRPRRSSISLALEDDCVGASSEVARSKWSRLWPWSRSAT
ncbi:FkbM family methyltransferase [bacterium]|nr:FkbM family methyltransferase [bacterium]